MKSNGMTSEVSYHPSDLEKMIAPIPLPRENDTNYEEALLTGVLSTVVDKICALESMPLPLFLQYLESRILLRAMQRSGWDRKEAARLLGLKYTTFHEKLKRYGLISIP